MKKTEKYGIDELKEVVDAIGLGIKFFTGKMKLWQRIVMKFGGATKLIEKLRHIIANREQIRNEALDLSASEVVMLDIYASEKLGIDKRFTEAFTEIIEGIEKILSGIGKLKDIKK